MKRLLIAVVVLIVLVVAYWLISPLLINKRVNEATVQNETSQTLAQGIFLGLGGHNAQGTAKLIKTGDKYYIRFEDDFRVTNGPDVYVYLGRDGKYNPSAQLGPLKGNIGAQNYEIPQSVFSNNYTEVWVWCRTFSVPFGKAELK